MTDSYAGDQLDYIHNRSSIGNEAAVAQTPEGIVNESAEKGNDLRVVTRACATRYCTRFAAPRGTRCHACNQAVYRLRWMKRGECVRIIQATLLKLERIRMAVGQT